MDSSVIVKGVTFKKGHLRLRCVSQLMMGDRREWDLAALRSYMLPHDIEEVRKIMLLDQAEDTIAWFYERTGVFSVRSAYKLAVAMENRGDHQEGSSERFDGSQPLYKGIWAAKVPPKVRVFAWRLAQDGLTTQGNGKRRTLVKHATCQVCSSKDESAYHVVVRCSKAATLTVECVRQPALAETDCKTLVDDVQRPANARSRLVGLVAEIQTVKNILLECTFKHVRRRANEIAHAVAQRACME
jgi:hypothetical protein